MKEVDNIKIAKINTRQKQSVPKTIYVEEKSKLVKLEGVQIVWSNFRNCYKLIDENDC